MTETSSSRSKLVSEIGQDIVKLLVEEPVKQAVREALSEEQARLATVEEQRRSDDRKEMTQEVDDSGSSRLPVKSLLLIVGLVGMVLLVKRIRDTRSEKATTHEPIERSGRSAGSTDRGNSAEMSEDNSQSGPGSQHMD